MLVDHVIWRTHDLEAAEARFADELGLRAAGGGRHTGQGTRNRVLPLGGGYLELVTIADADEAAGSPFGAAIAAAPEGLVGWAVSVDDARAEGARLAVAVSSIEREGFFAVLAGVGEALATPALPFFIERDAPITAGDAGGIAKVVVGGDAEALRAWLGGAQLPVEVEPGPPALRAVHLGSGAVIR